MNVFTVMGVIGVSIVALSGILAFISYRLSVAVTQNNQEIEAQSSRYKPARTAGYKIATDAPQEQQFKEARQEAAKRAAALPRGANMRIGRGQKEVPTASKVLNQDPISAFKIASQQGWQGLGEFDRYQAAATGAGGAVQVQSAGPKVKRKLVPGKDYPVVEVTAEMSGPEKRKARIANAKAKAAAMKELKAQGADMVAAAPPPAAQAQPAQQSAAELGAAAGIEEPDLIEITDDMAPADVRKARIANAKAKSAYKKALKAAGIDPSRKSAPAPQQQAAAPAAPAPAAPAPAGDPGAEAGIEKPDLVEITDDMSAGEVRKARISNAKAMSAYKKALKAAGIDPSKANEVQQPAPQQAQQAPAPAAPAGDPAAEAGIERPDLIEITDDMEPGEVRKARISNAKAKSAFKKELKAAGIDPATVEI